MDLIYINGFISSVKHKNLQTCKTWFIPFINREKSSNEKCPLCGTPNVTRNSCNLMPKMLSYWHLSDKNDWNHDKRELLKPDNSKILTEFYDLLWQSQYRWHYLSKKFKICNRWTFPLKIVSVDNKRNFYCYRWHRYVYERFRFL